ncbi:MAG: RRXRR domain-containing protein [Desulfitobacteriaceae bacterium]
MDTHVRLVDKVSALGPVNKVVIEVASFDIQTIKNPGIQGKDYQQREQYGFWKSDRSDRPGNLITLGFGVLIVLRCAYNICFHKSSLN